MTTEKELTKIITKLSIGIGNPLNKDLLTHNII